MKPPLGMLGFVSALVVVALSQPTRAAACSGQSLSFDQAIVISDGAIYAGRITGAEYRAYAYDITMDIELVVRGDPVERLHRAQAGFVCNAIEPGQWGYMVRDVRDREFPVGPDDLFFRVGRYYALSALASAGLPDTATGADARPTVTGHSFDLIMMVVGAASFVLGYHALRPGGRAQR